MIAYDDVTQILGIITALREPFDHHGGKVASAVMNLARVFGLQETDVAMIGIAARLHDVGKLLISDQIVNAERKLTDEEREKMKLHTTLGWEIVQQAGCDPVILDVVRHHHERMDGKGYPDGLIGAEIPLPAKMTTICDVYEALISPRPYRAAYSHNFAMAFIQKDKGTIFDPQLVDLFFAKVAHG